MKVTSFEHQTIWTQVISLGFPVEQSLGGKSYQMVGELKDAEVDEGSWTTD